MDRNIIYPKQLRNAKIPIERNRCFVLMPFSKNLNIVYGVIKKNLQESGYVCNRADEIAGSKAIINKILVEIAKSQFIIVDMSDLNPNVFYELGIAHTMKDSQNVILLKQKDYKTPFDITHLTYIEYDPNNLMLLTSQLINFIEETKYISEFHLALNKREIISVIHDNKDEFVNYIQFAAGKNLSAITDILNREYDTIDKEQSELVLGIFSNMIGELIAAKNNELLEGVLRVYYELISNAPYSAVTDQFTIDFFGFFFDEFQLQERDVLAWQTDLALALATKGLKMNIVMPWIINYFSRTKSTTVDLNRYKLERFLLLTSDPIVDNAIQDALFSGTCYIREHMADIIGEKKMHSASNCLVQRLAFECNYYSAISIIRAIGKLKSDGGIDCITNWINNNQEEIIATKQFFVMKHARISIMQLDNTENSLHLTNFDLLYSKYLENYNIL